jgi:hypothetical protein
LFGGIQSHLTAERRGVEGTKMKNRKPENKWRKTCGRGKSRKQAAEEEKME